MAQSWNPFAAANAAEPAASTDDGGVLPSDPTTLGLDQLMNLRLRGTPRQDPEKALEDGAREDGAPAAANADVPGDEALPADLTTLSLGDLLNLRVRASRQEDEKDKENADEKNQTDPQDNGEETTDAQLIAADDTAAAAAAAEAADTGEAETAPGDGDDSGDGGESGDAAPPPASGGEGTDTGAADFGRTIEILPAELTYVAALQSANTVQSAPPAPPVAAPAPVLRHAEPPPPPAAPSPPANAAPVAAGDQAAGDEDAAIAINVLGNDSDADGDPLRVAAVTQGQHGQVTVNADGTLTYAPAADFFGTDSFTYTLADGRGGTSTATVSLVVRPVNDAPVAVADSARTEQGQPVTVAVLANDSDVDGDALRVTAAGQGANGKVGINADGTLTYVPASGFAGTDSFTYTISDGRGGNASGTVSVHVSRANAPPAAANGLAAMEAETPISGTLTAADTDNAPGELQYSLDAGPAHGTAVVQADGAYTYTPDAGFAGTDTFSFGVADPSGASDTAAVTVSVLAKNIDPGSGREFGVNTTTAAGQQAPAISALAGGGFVAVWESQNQDGSSVGIFAQRFDAAAQPVGSEFQVNTFTANGQAAPAVAALADGGFVAVWESQNQDGSNKGIFAQRYDASGQAAGPEVQVNTFTANAQEAPDVAALADGGYVVVWQSQNQDGNNMGVFAQRFDAGGQAAGAEFRVNTFTQNAQQAPAVSALADGGFVAVWESQNPGRNHPEIYSQRYAADGQTVGGETRVSATTQHDLHAPDVAALTGGGHVVVWQAQNQDGSGNGVYGQLYAANGVRSGDEFRINTETAQGQQTAAVTATADGGFVAVWESSGQDGSSFGIFGQRYDGNGAAVGQEFQINTFTAGFQGSPDVAVLADGSLAVSWQSEGYDGSSYGVAARVFDASISVGHTFAGGPGNDSFIGGTEADTATGGAGNDLLTGGAGDDALDGGAGNDRLDGSLGADQLFGGDDDDVLLWDPADALVDGGTGRDTLAVSGGGDVDLAAFPNKIGGLEAVDLASDAGANHLTLDARDILDISDTDILAVLGDGADSVDAGAGWAAAGTDGQGSDIYTQSVGGAIVTLIVDSDILLNGDILS